jgi:hypothetical protein
MRYVLWCQAHADSSSSSSGSSITQQTAAAVLGRAVGTFCRKSAALVLFAARFYEAAGQMDAARAQFEHLTSTLAPGLLEVSAVYVCGGGGQGASGGQAVGCSAGRGDTR